MRKTVKSENKRDTVTKKRNRERSNKTEWEKSYKERLGEKDWEWERGRDIRKGKQCRREIFKKEETTRKRKKDERVKKYWKIERELYIYGVRKK